MSDPTVIERKLSAPRTSLQAGYALVEPVSAGAIIG
jgi:hypothetical protein